MFRKNFAEYVQQFGRIFAHLIFGLKIYGDDKIRRREGAFILVCNHISGFDPPVLGVSFPREVACMAKMELFKSRFGDFFLRKLNTFPVNREGTDRKSIRHAISLLRNDMVVLIFPEGTRSNDGALLPLKPGVILIASRANVPVLPAYIHGTTSPLKSMLRMGTRIDVHYGDLIEIEDILAARRESGTAAALQLIRDGILRTGVNAGFLTEEDPDLSSNST